MARSVLSLKTVLASSLFAVALTFTTLLAHAADPPTSGTTVAPKPASSHTPTAVPRKSAGGSAKPFLVGGLDGTGIRRAAPVGPKAAAAAASAKKDGP